MHYFFFNNILLSSQNSFIPILERSGGLHEDSSSHVWSVILSEVPKTPSGTQVHKSKLFITVLNITTLLGGFFCVEFPPVVQKHSWEKVLLP